MGLRLEVTVDGETHDVDLDLSLQNLTLREGLRLQDSIGVARFDRMMDGGKVPRDLHIIEALIWCKLATLFPQVGLEDFDLPLDALSALKDANGAAPVEVPMETPDGETVTAEVAGEPPNG